MFFVVILTATRVFYDYVENLRLRVGKTYEFRSFCKTRFGRETRFSSMKILFESPCYTEITMNDTSDVLKPSGGVFVAETSNRLCRQLVRSENVRGAYCR